MVNELNMNVISVCKKTALNYDKKLYPATLPQAPATTTTYDQNAHATVSPKQQGNSFILPQKTSPVVIMHHHQPRIATRRLI